MIISFYTCNPSLYKKQNETNFSITKIRNLFSKNKLGFFNNNKIPNYQKEVFEYLYNFVFITEETIINFHENIINFINDKNYNTIFILSDISNKNFDKYEIYKKNMQKIVKFINKINGTAILFNNSVLELVRASDYIVTDTKSKNGNKEFGYNKEYQSLYKKIFEYFKDELIDIRYSEKKINIKEDFYLINIYSIPNKYKYWIFKKNKKNLYEKIIQEKNLKFNKKIDLEFTEKILDFIKDIYKIPFEVNKSKYNNNNYIYYKYEVNYNYIFDLNKNYNKKFIMQFIELDYLTEILKYFEDNKYYRYKYQKSAVNLEPINKKLSKINNIEELYLNNLNYLIKVFAANDKCLI